MPTAGAEGADGATFITTSAEATEVHPKSFVTVKVLVVSGASPDIVVLVPEPVVVVPPGDLVRVHVPEAGNPFNTTLPLARAQVG